MAVIEKAGTTPVTRIARAFGITPQRLYDVEKQHGITYDDWFNPDAIFNTLLESGNSSPLRTRLTDPATRAAIRDELNLAAIRGQVPDASEKITSIK